LTFEKEAAKGRIKDRMLGQGEYII